MFTELSSEPEIGFVVDAGASVGYGHVVRSLRIARRLDRAGVRTSFFPLSSECGDFLRDREATVRWDADFPALVVSDLPAPHPSVERIRYRGSRHIGIRDLGLARCDADVVIDGSITTVNPYTARPDQMLFTGPRYMVTSPTPVGRRPGANVAFVTLGGGSSASHASELAEALVATGFEVYATAGFDRDVDRGRRRAIGGMTWVTEENGIAAAMSRATVAVATSGVSLYEMLAAGIPTVVVSVNEFQLRTANAFDREGAIEAMGPIEDVSASGIAERVRGLAVDDDRRRKLVRNGRRIVDGQGLMRVSEIVRNELCRKESH